MKNKVLAAIVSMSIINWCSEYGSKAEVLNTKNETNNLTIENETPQQLQISDFAGINKVKNETNHEISICLSTDGENSFTHTKAIKKVLDPHNTILEYPLSQLFQEYGNKPHPLRVSWVEKNFSALLWKNWIERLHSKIPQKLNSRSEKITSDTKYEMWDTLRFQLIDPLLKDDFPQYLSDQLKEPWFEEFSDPEASIIAKKISDKTNQIDSNEKSDFIYDIVVKRAPSWKAALALYRDWELFMATYASIWRSSRKTKTWQFKILDKNPYKRSHKYHNAAMPFSLHFGDGFAFHQWHVTWYDLSHGCGRVPGVYADVLFSSVYNDIAHTDIFIPKDLYNFKK